MELNHEDELPGHLSLRVFGSPAALAQAVAGRVQEAVMTGVRARGRASLALDAHPVLRRGYVLLASAALPWSCVHISLSAAGSAPQGVADPRERFLHDTLLQGGAAQSNLSWQASPDRDDAAADEHDLLLLAMSANGNIPALSAGAESSASAAVGLLASRRIVIVGQGLMARDAFERMALSRSEAFETALHVLAQEATQPVEFCWCR